MYEVSGVSGLAVADNAIFYATITRRRISVYGDRRLPASDAATVIIAVRRRVRAAAAAMMRHNQTASAR